MKALYLLLFLVVANLYSCQSQSAGKAVSPKVFSEQVKATKNPVLLDVRTPEEFAEGYIPNAVNIDFYKPDFKTQIARLNKEQTYFVYCKTGGRSASTVDIMRKEGFKNVVDLDGGFLAWEKAKLPIVKQ
jgi:rhodanese-related sulfurtransferase